MKDESRWRRGDRDAEARRAHLDAQSARLRDLLIAAHPQWLLNGLLEAIRSGVSPQDAARQAGTSYQALYALAGIDEKWRQDLDEATAAMCICGGTGWKRASRRSPRSRCHCPIARAFRAEESRRERGARTVRSV